MDEYYEEESYEIENIVQEDEKGILKLEVDLEILKKQIVENIKYNARDTVFREIKKDIVKEIITDNYKGELREILRELIKTETLKIFNEEITTTDSWGNSKKTIKFKDLVKEKVKENLAESGYFSDNNSSKFKENLQTIINYEISDHTKHITKEVKNNISEVFNTATKKELSEAMFDVLMQNETYQKLNNSIKLLGN